MRNLRLTSSGLLRCGKYSSLGILSLVGLGMFAPSDAAAQTVGDIKIRAPNILLLVDTSGSMNSDQTGGFADCISDKSRWVILVETLTGTVNNLTCNTSGGAYQRIRSNGCAPRFNDRAKIVDALDDADGDGSPYAWPEEGGGGKNKEPVGFRQGGGSPPGGGWCWYQKGGDWDQQNDGVIDIYADKIRFALMTFDSVEASGGFPVTEFVPWGLVGFDPWRVNWNAFTDPYRNDSPPNVGSQQASYWYESAANNWLRVGMPPTSYAGNIFYRSGNAQLLRGMGIDGWGVCTTYPVAPTPATGYYCPQASFDIGAKNPKAGPTYGRMMGFGDPAASVAETVAHNDMVQLGIIGVTPNINHSTPLAAMMRDAYELMLVDTTTEAVTIPHSEKDPPVLAKVGPKTDPYVFGAEAGCRQQHVLAITDGEPANDLVGTTMGEWAENLWVDSPAGNKVNTYIVGVGMDTARWSSDQAAATTTDCALLLAADLNAGGMCERSSLNATEWRYADECTPGGPSYNGTGLDCIPNNADDPALVPGGALTDNDRSAVRACCNILEVAIKGRDPADVLSGLAKPYFPKTQAELKTMLSDLISNIAGGTLSRTVPVFTTAAASSVTGSAAANSYEIRSALKLPPGNGMWLGTLERIRWTCASGTINMTPARGDDFASNLAQGAPAARKFFTVSPDTDQGIAQRSLRPRQTSQTAGDPNTQDCLYECGSSNVGDIRRMGGASGAGKDVLQSLATLKSAIDTSGGLDADEMLDLQGSDKKGCEAATNNGNNLGGGWRNHCTNAILEWYGGHPNPTGPNTPTRDPVASGGAGSPLGGIYKSVPVVVEPPKAVEEDELFANERTNPGPDTNSFVKKYGQRPTMVYAQSVDGQLHAFVLNPNANAGPWGAPANVPTADSNANNELWTFIPPAVMPALFRNFNVHARLSDGPITVSDVPLSIDPNDATQFLPYRTMADLKAAKGEYRTIMVVSSGPSVLGGFYYAMDVTDPLKPRFLWQLKDAGKDKNKLRDLFGDNLPGAAITVLRLKELGGPEKMVPVAILAGGSEPGAPVAVRNRRKTPSSYWNNVWGHTPRDRIRDWGDSVASRSLTVVELYSGRIIMRLGGSHCSIAGPGCPAASVPSSDHPLDNSDNPILNANVVRPLPGAVGIFDSPLSGTPAVYPSGVGKVGNRVYVGDQDGTVWRVNLSDPDPRNWGNSVEIAFDGYNFNDTENTMDDARIEVGTGAPGKLGTELGVRSITGADTFAIKGQPITTKPLISTEENGHTVVSFSTGDPEVFQLESVDAINVLVSFVDYVDPATQKFRPYVNRQAPGASPGDPLKGIEMAFMDGTAVTGPLNLFDGQLIFAYFVPKPGTTCTFGKGGWCAAHYLDHAAADVPDPVMDVDGVPGYELCSNFAGDEVVFGIEVNQKPSCQPAAVTIPDPWLAGSYSAITTSNAGAYEIVMHTGQGGSAENGAATKSTRKALTTPRSQTFVRSWVNAIE